MRPGIEPTSSWIPGGFITAEPQWELRKDSFLPKLHNLPVSLSTSGSVTSHVIVAKSRCCYHGEAGKFSWAETFRWFLCLQSRCFPFPPRTQGCLCGWTSLFFFFRSFCLSRATPAAYGGSQARGLIRAVAAGLHHSHSNTGSEPRL